MKQLGKKAGAWLPPMKEMIIIVVAVIIISIIFAVLLYAGNEIEETDIYEKGREIKQSQTLFSLLRTPVRVSIPEIIEKGFGSEIIYSELITIWIIEEDGDLKDKYEDLLETKGEYALDGVYGDGSWEIKIITPDNKEERIGKITWSTTGSLLGRSKKSFETKIPTHDRRLITVALIIEVEE